MKWCLTCNTPVIGDYCGKCNSPAHDLRISILSDPRPAFIGGLSLIREALTNEFSEKAFEILFEKGTDCILFGRLPYLDFAVQVISDSCIVGHLFFDLYTMSWRFKPLYPAIVKLLENGLIDKISISSKVERGEIIGKSSDEKFKAIIYENQIFGLAEVRGDKLIVARIFREREKEIPTVNSKQSLKSLIEANDETIRTLESRSCKHLFRIARRIGKPVVISYSGGKDSLACLHLAFKAGIEPILLFGNTGMEMPETIRNFEKVSDKYSLRAEVSEAKEIFWKEAKTKGPPARDFRWCCKNCKLKPMLEMIQSNIGNALLVVGQRRLESHRRLRYPSVWKDPIFKGYVSTSPINDWPALAIWTYLMSRNLLDDVNELYFKGFSRIGCYMCPSGKIGDYRMVESLHPDLWREWDDFLIEWMKKHGYSEYWRKYALWRWKNLPKKMKMFLTEIRRLESVH